jgi:SCY1-like protein 1
MKLGGVKKAEKKSALAELTSEWDDAEGDEVENAWGNEDLIDVNADEDDWGKLVLRWTSTKRRADVR